VRSPTGIGLVFFACAVIVASVQLAPNSLHPAFAQDSKGERSAAASPVYSGEARTRETANPEKVQVTGLKLLTLQDQTRVMLNLSGETRFEVRQLKENPAKQIPARIYIDIIGAQLAAGVKDTSSVDNGILRQVRIGQYSEGIVRVVLDMTALRRHKAFFIAEPTQLVIDVLGERASQEAAARQAPPRSAPVTRNDAAAARNPERQAAPGGLRKIVLDPGHGGKDPGALGAGGIAEKDIVLSVAKKLARKLRTELGVQVVLTRTDDRFVPLEDRTALANSEDADLFISLHVNASPNADARGIETYYLDNTTDEAAIRLAARENATSRRNISDLQFILSDMIQNMKLEDSITLAHRLQTALVGGMSKVMGDVRDLGVKKALFHVLVGARMPSVLVEMFFISNRAEAKSMSQDSHQDALVESLYEGIQRFGQTTLAAKTL
jgi:N-acetylmuramoyl-L-alanine amidase